MYFICNIIFFFKQKTAYEMRISDWSSDVCSSDLPKKAIRALKWAVEQMEDRYRMMSSLSVRNLASYNDKVRGALAKGKSLGRRVQTGYDPDTGQPVYEEETLDYAPLPQIVIVVDELADLMMTAGKEVEFLIQRLAQKARDRKSTRLNSSH